MRKFTITIAILFCFISLTGCGLFTERVPPGYQGMIMKPSGLTGTVLQPGNHSCWGRDRLILIEAKEVTKTESLSVLCADDLNFKFDLKVRSRIAKSDGKGLMAVLDRQGANIVWSGKNRNGAVGIIKYDFLYATYIKDSARSISRGLISKYETTQIRDAREAVQKEIQNNLLKAIKGTPVEITMVATSNFDYPEVITKAVENRRRREIQIGEEKAKQAMALLQAENRLKVADKMKAVRAAEAKAEAIYIEILGEALTYNYLDLRAIERDMVLYKNVSPGDKVIVTNGNGVSPIVGSLAGPRGDRN